MRKYLNRYQSKFEKDLNLNLMHKTSDDDLVEYVKDSWKSLQILKNIEILSFDYSTAESSININNIMTKRDKKKRKKDRHIIKFINDDRYGKLTVKIKISVVEIDTETNTPVMKQKIIKKEILIPLQDESGYYHLKGKKYYMIYQMVDKSTFITPSTVTLKSLMPIAVKRDMIEVNSVNCTDVTGNNFRLPIYNVFVFRKEIPIILFYLANGVKYTLSYLGVDSVISFVDTAIEDDEEYLYFQISSQKCYLKVLKEPFIKHQYIKSVVGGILHVSSNRLTLDKLDDRSIWLKKLSNNNTVEKGEDVLNFLNRLMDETTKKVLLLNDFNKKDVYAILRWMMMNFNELRQKDNLSLNNKRLRCNEYIASLLTQEFSTRLNKVMTLAAKATMVDFTDMFGFSGDILLQKMHSSGILKFDENINDMDFFSHFKYTNKGPNSLGGKNAKNISAKYKGIHPSQIGKVDLLVCGSNDPGTSGILSPFNNMDSLYFDNSSEPDDFFYNFTQELVSSVKDKKNMIFIDADNKSDFYKILDKLSEFSDQIKITGSSKHELALLIEDASGKEGDTDGDGGKTSD